ncbi:putative integumentary mucin C.1, partial [Apostichopus japonicus]
EEETTTPGSTTEKATTTEGENTTMLQSTTEVTTEGQTTTIQFNTKGESTTTVQSTTNKESTTAFLGITATTEAPEGPEENVTTTTMEIQSTTTSPEDSAGCFFDGIMYDYGEKVPSRDSCSEMYCTEFAGLTIERKKCNLNCVGKLVYKEGQCCPICEREEEPCKKRSAVQNGLKIDDCIYTGPVLMTYCDGSCPSMARTYTTFPYFDMMCTCCKPLTYRTKELPLQCPDGSITTYTHLIIEQCSCERCEFQPKIPQLGVIADEDSTVQT